MTPLPQQIIPAKQSGVRQGGPSFALSNRIERAVWSVAWTLLARWTPPMLHGWRVWLLRRFGATVGAKVKVYSSAKIWLPRNFSINDGASVGPRVTCYCIAPIRLEAGAIVSQGAHLCTGSHLIDDPSFQLVARSIRIGADAWVAAEAFVGLGVSVGDGAVLGARGVAMRNLAPWTVFAGNPARPLRRRLRPD